MSGFQPFQQNSLGGIPSPPTPAPATIAASGSWSSGVMPCGGFGALAASCELSQVGTLTIQRYMDLLGSVPLGAPVTQALNASTLATAWVRDGQPAASWQVTVANTSGSIGNLTNVNLLVQQ